MMEQKKEGGNHEINDQKNHFGHYTISPINNIEYYCNIECS